MNRRKFIQTAALTTAGLTLANASFSASSTTKLRAAVIGHTGRGDYGHSLETIFANRPEVELVALADPDPVGRAKTAQKIGAARQYADYRELIDKERPQLVSIAMRQSDLHYPIALAALKQGAHLYSEKPFTTTPAEADELLAEAKQRGLKIAVAHTMRMMPIMQRLKQGLAQGLIGDLLEMRAYGKQDARAGGEDMMVLGSHLFDLMRLFAGDPQWCAAQVLAKGKNITPADARLVKDNVGLLAGDRVFAQFAFPNDIQATFTSVEKLRETTGHWGIEMLGSKSVVRINCDISPNVFIRQATPWKPEGTTDTWAPLDPSLISGAPPHNLGPVGDWIEAIAKNREPECSGANGAWAVEMVMAIYQAALSGTRATFPLKVRTHPLAMK